MKFRQIQNGCGCDFQSHPFFVCGKMLPICPQNAPYLSLSDEPMNFCFSGRKNAPYLSPNHFNTFVSSLLYADENCGIISKKMLPICPRWGQMLLICPQNAPYLSPKTSQSVAKNLPKCHQPSRILQNAPYLSPRRLKCSLSVVKNLPKCRQNAPYLSPKCSLSVPDGVL